MASLCPKGSSTSSTILWLISKLWVFLLQARVAAAGVLVNCLMTPSGLQATLQGEEPQRPERNLLIEVSLVKHL